MRRFLTIDQKFPLISLIFFTLSVSFFLSVSETIFSATLPQTLTSSRIQLHL
ncbi:hypothetical protein C5167_048308 [Papaver somniferum]|uniref:Uncharacterized protein n=1 Tax=Papaver somniferum TaxID=3469 RepID=A0A4Y7KL60_PAPSO|nr:hypothetical protein C5167_048308 [Papaver somniferum]